MVAVSRPTKLWWLIGLILLVLCLVIQLPARWIVQKFSPNTPYLQSISGNLWQGNSQWQMMMQPNMPLAGTLDWQWQPWQLLMGKVGLATDISSGKTRLIGVSKVGYDSWQITDFSGKITPDVLKQLVNWQLPDTPIMAKDLTIVHGKQGFEQASGTLNWAGGQLGYPSGGRVYKINMPTMVGTLSVDKSSNSPSQSNQAVGNQTASPTTTSNGKRLHIALTTPQGQRLGDFYIDNDMMVDVALTQRLVKNMPDYHGQGADDSVVVNVRQPMTGLR